MIALTRPPCCTDDNAWCKTCGGKWRYLLGTALTAAHHWVGEVWPPGTPEPPRPSLGALKARLRLTWGSVPEDVRAWMCERAREIARRTWEERQRRERRKSSSPV